MGAVFDGGSEGVFQVLSVVCVFSGPQQIEIGGVFWFKGHAELLSVFVADVSVDRRDRMFSFVREGPLLDRVVVVVVAAVVFFFEYPVEVPPIVRYVFLSNQIHPSFGLF